VGGAHSAGRAGPSYGLPGQPATPCIQSKQVVWSYAALWSGFTPPLTGTTLIPSFRMRDLVSADAICIFDILSSARSFRVPKTYLKIRDFRRKKMGDFSHFKSVGVHQDYLCCSFMVGSLWLTNSNQNSSLIYYHFALQKF
jgi:hypothetical protein